MSREWIDSYRIAESNERPLSSALMRYVPPYTSFAGQLAPAPDASTTVATHIACGHLARPLNRIDADALIERCIGCLTEAPPFDTIAFMGMSGALVAPVLAHRLKKELIVVRKASDMCVSPYSAEGYTRSKHYIIVDDLISSGRSAARIVNNVREFSPDAQLVALLLYCTGKGLWLPGSTHFDEVMWDTRPNGMWRNQ